MYNEELKNSFIDNGLSHLNTPRSISVNNFNLTEDMEMLLGKDLSSFTYNEIISLLKTLALDSIDRCEQLKSLYRRYTAWCITQGLVEDGQNHFEEITLDDIRGCLNTVMINKKILDYKTLIQWTNAVINASDAFILLCLFEGVSETNIIAIRDLKESDVNFKDKTVTFNGRTVAVSQKLLSTIEETINEQYLERKDGREFILEPDGTIIKSYRRINGIHQTPEQKRSWLAQRTNNLLHDLSGNLITTKDVVKSGQIYYITQRSQELGISSIEYLTKYPDEVNERCNQKDAARKFLRNHFKEYLE